jgi:hypothetical protein
MPERFFRYVRRGRAGAWGFEYKTVAFTWAKRTPTDKAWHLGLGYWTRQNSEHCLLGTRGKPKRHHTAPRALAQTRMKWLPESNASSPVLLGAIRPQHAPRLDALGATKSRSSMN